MSATFQRDIRWLAAREAFADHAWDLDPDVAFARRVWAARAMHDIERQYAEAHRTTAPRPTS